MATFTVVGAGGFIGSHLRARLEEQGHAVQAPERSDGAWLQGPGELGHVIYCAGLTSDTLTRPYEAVRAHVDLVAEILERARFDSLLYLSSTRVYAGAASGSEDARLCIDPRAEDDFFASTKLMGEALCAAGGPRPVRVVRLSNVYGADVGSGNFLSSIISDALLKGEVVLETALDSAKDYVSIDDVCDVLPQIALGGRQDVYNVASAINVPNRELIEALADITSCTWQVEEGAPTRTFPVIDTARLRAEFPWEPATVLDDLPELVSVFAEELAAP